MQRRVRTTIRPDDVLTVQDDADFETLRAQGLILEVLNDTNDDGENNSEVPPTPPVPPVEVQVEQTPKKK